jgi:hypothetical protein
MNSAVAATDTIFQKVIEYLKGQNQAEIYLLNHHFLKFYIENDPDLTHNP